MNIYSWNVRGLNIDPTRRTCMAQVLASYPSRNVLIALQETKLREFSHDYLIKKFVASYHYGVSSAQGTCGGVLTLVSRDWQVLSSSSDFVGKWVLLCLHKLGSTFSVLNLYASSLVSDRIEFWSNLPPIFDYRLIVLGDFTIYIDPSDGPHTISFSECVAWLLFQSSHSLVDACHILQHFPHQTCTNCCLGPFFCSVRLDHFYLSSSGSWLRLSFAKTHRFTTLSDHSLVMLRCRFQELPPYTFFSPFVMNSLLK
ncbi:hypothetical protein O6H91_Y327500 [Diphasiastrum complanatum]|nr:hypothetical protein O6H91_Y327500 [Diphasiastrum complanatum]